MKFSVLMSIYYKEKVDYFNRAMQSIWNEQSVKPNEIVLVQDGKLTDELYISIKQWQDKLGTIFKTIVLEENIGLGDALNIGMKECSCELIARMDTDDISLPNRFEKQLKFFENNNIDVCSSWISEFENNENNIVSYRKVPENHNSIVNYFKMRNAINHPAVIYKKAAVEKAGGYKKMIGFEDYYLWVRMMLNGAKFYNIQAVLVNMRAGYGQLERRRGWNYALNELKLLIKFREIGFLNNFEFIKNLLIKFPIRIMPKKIIKYIYGLIRTKGDL